MNHESMDGDVAQLIKLLKKILKNHPQGQEVSKLMEQKAMNVNLCFLTFIPMNAEELDDFEDMYEEYLSRLGEATPERAHSPLEFKLSTDDVDFLKQAGIQF